jgi:hypothetical protein
MEVKGEETFVQAEKALVETWYKVLDLMDHRIKILEEKHEKQMKEVDDRMKEKEETNNSTKKRRRDQEAEALSSAQVVLK